MDKYYFDKYLDLKALHWAPAVLSLLAVILALFSLSMESVKDANQFAVAIAVLQIALAIAAFFGFWAVRSVAKDKSGEVARETANNYLRGPDGNKAIQDAAKRELSGDLSSLIRRIVEEYVEEMDGISESDEDISLQMRKGLEDGQS